MRRVDEIIGLLRERGPMTVFEIAAALGFSEKTVTFHIGTFRKYEKGIRIAGYDTSARKRKTRYYAVGKAPDAQPPAPRRPPSVRKRIKHPNMTAEERAEFEQKQRLAMLAAQTKPFRHPQDVAFFGAYA